MVKPSKDGEGTGQPDPVCGLSAFEQSPLQHACLTLAALEVMSGVGEEADSWKY